MCCNLIAGMKPFLFTVMGKAPLLKLDTWHSGQFVTSTIRLVVGTANVSVVAIL